ncbi:putative recombination initiation defects 3 isoform X2 [Phoenix dactylifera]|uniref:Recombination initiation defects 3 isoform X2 n=1 Tax=Phoenix dactylifera TaxID=42345 RepID=A0A8B9AAH8_PHODC|nr:putative recombination initiation defects 3 isoform X2 [Phoenix dactylifera]
MKLKINKACDLSSISVLPPRSKGMTCGADGSGLGRIQGSQHRSQSQQSFSQGPSLSQLSQSSLEENLAIDQRFGSQEKDNSSKRVSFAPNRSVREESQLQLSRASNNVLRRWNSCSVPENRCQISDELEHSIRLMEGSVNRLGIVLDSVQGDVMQVNRAVKEVSLEMEGIRQKIFLLDNSVQQMLKREDDIKAFLDESLKSIADQIIKNSNSNKLNEITSAFSALPEKIEARLLKLQEEVCRVFTKEKEVIVSVRKPSNNKCTDSIQSTVKMFNMDHKQSLKSHIPVVELPDAPLLGNKKRNPVSKVEEGKSRALEPKLTNSKHHMALKQEAIPQRMQGKDFRVVIDLDEDNDGVGSCLVKKETGKEIYLMDEAREETMRILRKARKRRRRLMNPVIAI